MSAFEHVTALLSFVYALALTHFLARIAELIVARERVKFSGLLALGMVNAVLLVFVNWLSLWDLRSVTSWDLASVAIQFLFAVSVCVVCALVGPQGSGRRCPRSERFFLAPTPLFLRSHHRLSCPGTARQSRLFENSEHGFIRKRKSGNYRNIGPERSRTRITQCRSPMGGRRFLVGAYPWIRGCVQQPTRLTNSVSDSGIRLRFSLCSPD